MKFIILFVLLLNCLHADNLGVNEKLGQYVPLDLTFINEDSKRVTLRELMDGKPTLLTLNYFRCAGICSPQLNDLAVMLARLQLAENTDYKVITVDFAENETPDLAVAKKKNLIHSMSRAYVADAWHFVIGENNSSGKLAQSVGFKYKKVVMPSGEPGYVHAATLIALSPTGKITRYLRGIEQLPADIEIAIKKAADEKVTPTISKNSPYCFTETPQGDIYMAKGGPIWALFMLSIVIGLFVYLIRRGRKNKGDEE